MNKETLRNIIVGFFVVILATVLIFAIKSTQKIKININNQEQQEEDNTINTEQEAKKEADLKIKQVKSIDNSDYILGDINNPVQIIVYSDFECPYCAQFEDTLRQVRSEFNDRVVITFRHYPLFIHPQAMLAAIASECAGEQGKFWEMHDSLFADNIDENFNMLQFKEDAKDLRLDQAKFNQCLDTEKYKEKVEKEMLEGKNSGVTGTPTIFINNEIYPGAYPYEDFTQPDGTEEKGLKSIIEEKLK